VLLLATVAFGVPLALSLSTRIHDEVQTQAHDQAALVAATAGDLLGSARRVQLAALAEAAARSLHGRVLIVNAGGRVLVDSAGPAEVGSSYGSRPELRRALAGTPNQIERYSRTLHREILATAVPVVHDGQIAGAVRVTQSIDSVKGAVFRVEIELIVIGLVVLLIGLLGGSVLASQISRPLRRLEQVARRVAQGELSARAVPEGSREQRSLAHSFNEMADRIIRLLDAQKDFVADASHQLRTPLTGLRLRLEEARASVDDDHASAHELDRAMTEVDRLSETVSELLLLSRAGERSLAGTNVDLGEVVAAALQRWTAEAAERKMALKVEAEHVAGSVWIAREDMDRALDALIENALHYSAAGTAVTLTAGPARIEVLDRGRGITGDERELVFDRFRRGSAGRAGPPGHGLGLPIARELARAWGGDLLLEPRPGGGTRAVLDLTGVDPASASAAPDRRPFASA
jgi:two-component system, OmpR family, sensor kinase